MARASHVERFSDADIAEHRANLRYFLLILRYALIGIALVLICLALWAG